MQFCLTFWLKKLIILKWNITFKKRNKLVLFNAFALKNVEVLILLKLYCSQSLASIICRKINFILDMFLENYFINTISSSIILVLEGFLQHNRLPDDASPWKYRNIHCSGQWTRLYHFRKIGPMEVGQTFITYIATYRRTSWQITKFVN